MNTTLNSTDTVVVQRLKTGYDRLHDSAPEVFALMCKLAWPILESFHGDLYHDAAWLRRMTKLRDEEGAERLEFFFGIGTDGTFVSLNGDGCHHRAGDAGQVWQLILTTDERRRHFVTAVRLGVHYSSRFDECDVCGDKRGAAYEGSTARPSDPSSRCCVTALCKQCADGDVEMLYEVQAKRVEAGFYHGVYFYE